MRKEDTTTTMTTYTQIKPDDILPPWRNSYSEADNLAYINNLIEQGINNAIYEREILYTDATTIWDAKDIISVEYTDINNELHFSVEKQGKSDYKLTFSRKPTKGEIFTVKYHHIYNPLVDKLSKLCYTATIPQQVYEYIINQIVGERKKWLTSK